MNPLAQKKQGINEVAFLTQNSIKISAIYNLPKITIIAVPAIILIHQGGSSKQEWMDLPIVNTLLENGYSILAYDIRLHRKSAKDGEFSDLYKASLDLLTAI